MAITSYPLYDSPPQGVKIDVFFNDVGQFRLDRVECQYPAGTEVTVRATPNDGGPELSYTFKDGVHVLDLTPYNIRMGRGGPGEFFQDFTMHVQVFAGL